MKHRTILFIAAIIAAISLSGKASAQETLANGLEIDKTIHNFGDILLDSGPVSCTFTLTNKSGKAAAIYNVTSSCGCTDVKWTREPIRPGGTGTISATYSNDEGPYPFDKTLTVYLSDVRKPVVLKLRGTSMARQLPLAERYPEQFGTAGFKEKEIKGGNLEQGGVKSGTVKVANLGNTPMSLTFTDITPELSLNLSPNPIPALGTADLNFTIRSSRDKWGKNWYNATPVVNGKKQNGQISIWAFTKENFDNLDKDQKAAGPRPVFETSTFSMGKVKKGKVVNAKFEFKNAGKSTFHVYKADADVPDWSHSEIKDAKPGETVSFTVTIDTSSMPVGEALAVITLTTNSPLRPIVNIFVAGWIE